MAPPSVEASVAGTPGKAFISTYGQSAGGGPLTMVKWVVNGVVLPARSTSVPARVCGPSPSAPVAYVAVAPATVGATVAAPSRVEPVTAESDSLAVTAIELAAAMVDPSAGVAETNDGGVLSMRREATTLGVETLPTASCATARRS